MFSLSMSGRSWSRCSLPSPLHFLISSMMSQTTITVLFLLMYLLMANFSLNMTNTLSKWLTTSNSDQMSRRLSTSPKRVLTISCLEELRIENRKLEASIFSFRVLGSSSISSYIDSFIYYYKKGTPYWIVSKVKTPISNLYDILPQNQIKIKVTFMKTTHIAAETVQTILHQTEFKIKADTTAAKTMVQMGQQMSAEIVKQSATDLNTRLKLKPAKILEESEQEQIKKDNMLTQGIQLDKGQRKTSTIGPFEVNDPLRGMKTQTTFDLMMSTLKASKKQSSKTGGFPFIKLQTPSEENIRDTQINNFIKEKEEKDKKRKMTEKITDQQRRLKTHLSKGPSFKFTFGNEGELLLFCANTLNPVPSYLRCNQKHYKVAESSERKKRFVECCSECERQVVMKKKVSMSVDSSQLSKLVKTLKSSKQSKTPKINKKSQLSLTNLSSEALQESGSKTLESRVNVFTNNQQRQLSHLPFFHLQPGVKLKQINENNKTKTVISENVVKKCRSQHIAYFKSHVQKKGGSGKISSAGNIRKIAVAASDEMKREREVKTARTKVSDRINTENQSLAHTLFDFI